MFCTAVTDHFKHLLQLNLPVLEKTVKRKVQFSNIVSVNLTSSKLQSSNSESSNFTDFISILMNLWGWDGTHTQTNRQRKHGLSLLLLWQHRIRIDRMDSTVINPRWPPLIIISMAILYIQWKPVNHTIHVKMKVRIHSVCFNSVKIIEVK